jgi:glycosyltransferase involved in cell wall biosynthesis
MNNLISVIMPVFNSSRFLAEAIESVIEQKYKNWELICVNDGSTDNSLDILKAYQKKDSRIQVYSQNNSGAAKARKLGIMKSKGDYISYLDSDDVYSSDYLYETIKVALKESADVVMPVLVACWGSSEEYNFNDKNGLKEGDVISPKIAFLRTFPWEVHGLNLYRSSHIKKYALSEISDENSYCADEYLTRYLLLYANKIAISQGEYFYRKNEGSVTNNFSPDKVSVLDINSKLFSLAENNHFTDSDLMKIADCFLSVKAGLKYNIIKNKSKMSPLDFNLAMAKLKNKYNWESCIRIDSLRKIKIIFLLKCNSWLLSLFFSGRDN